MRGDEDIPCPIFRGEAPECVGTCQSKTRTDTKDQTPHQIGRDFRHYCESPALTAVCEQHGVLGARFAWNTNLRWHSQQQQRHNNHKGQRRRFHVPHLHLPHLPQSSLSKQFWAAYQEHPSLNLALAFHGTAEANVTTILKRGLDPQFRRTQAFGKGDYFSKEPGLAATYRQEGHCLVVFLLLVPKDHEPRYSQKDRDIIVVPENSHQLPLGVIRFAGVDETKIAHSQQMRLVQRSLKTEALQKEWLVDEAQLRTTLEAHLADGQVEQASLALKHATRYHQLSDSVARDMAVLVHQYVPNAEQRCRWFPSLAKTTTTTTMSTDATSNIPQKSLAALEDDARQSWKAFWAMKLDPHRNHIIVKAPTPLVTTKCASPLPQQPTSTTTRRVVMMMEQ